MRSRSFSIVAGAVVWSLSACGGDDLIAPRTGQIRVSVATTGAGPDPGPYTLTLDEQPPVPVAPTATITLDADRGEHAVALGGVPGHCSVEAGTTRTATVAEGVTAEVAFTVTCSPIPGSVGITVTTVGSLLDADGYLLRVDDREPEPIGVNDGVTIEGLAPGSHSVRLDGVAANCRVESDNPVAVEVTVDHAAAVAFAVTCHAGVERWTPMPSGTAADLTGVWSANDGTVIAIGERGTRTGVQGLVLGYAGGSWAPQYREDDLRPRGVWGSAADDVYLVGYGLLAEAARVLHYDGQSWASVADFDREDVAGQGLESVWGASASDVFVVGFEDVGPFRVSAIWHFDGGGWLRMEVPGPVQPELTDVWGSSGSDVYAVGRDEASGVVLRYDGSSWAPVLQVDGVLFNGVWGSGPDDVFAAGFLVEERDDQFFVSGVVWHFDGTAWSPMDLPDVGVLYEVWGTSGSDVYVVGEEGLILHYDGTGWERTTVGRESLLGVWGGGAGEVFAVGNNGTILHGEP